MIDKRRIEEVFKEYNEKVEKELSKRLTRKPTSAERYAGTTSRLCAFIAGAKWMQEELLKDLWHSIEENPMKYHKCLVEVMYHRPLNMTDEIDYVTSHLTDFGWDESSFKRSDYTIKRWIYIDDLLKGGNQ